MHGLALHHKHAQLDQAVVQQQAVARLHVPGEFRVVRADRLDGAVVLAKRAVDAEPCPRFERDRSVAKTAHAHLGAGQVRQHRHVAPKIGRRRAQGGDAPFVIGALAVREVDARHVQAGGQQVVQHAGRVRRRTQRGDDAGLALSRHGTSADRARATSAGVFRFVKA